MKCIEKIPVANAGVSCIAASGLGEGMMREREGKREESERERKGDRNEGSTNEATNEYRVWIREEPIGVLYVLPRSEGATPIVGVREQLPQASADGGGGRDGVAWLRGFYLAG